jgi:hypothetical protein
MKTKIIPISVAVILVLFVFFRHEERAVTNTTLSEFFETGTLCNSVLTQVPFQRIAKIGRKSENACYAKSFVVHLLQTSPDEQTPDLAKGIAAFKEADRLGDGTVALLMKAVMLNRNQQKNATMIPEEIFKVNVELLDDLLTIAEACATSRNNVIALVAESEKIIPEVRNSSADRAPSSDVDSLFSRYALLKNRWIIHDNEIQAYRDRQFAHTVQ